MIVFTKVRYKNFLAAGDQFIEVDLTRSTNTLVVGTNGAGKSTLIEAITFALFDKPFRKISKKQLVNSVNGKACVVEIDFVVGGSSYTVRRGIKPTVFEIIKDGTLLDQQAAMRDDQAFLEQQILKFNYKSFTQVVVIGNASFTPFMELSSIDRRDIVEDLLDIQIFSAMGKVIKERASQLKTDLLSTDQSISTQRQLLNQQISFADEIEEDNTSHTQQLRDTVGEIDREILGLATKIKGIQKQLTEVEAPDIELHRNEYRKFEKMDHQFDSQYDALQTTLDFFNHTDTCPTCKQTITDDHKSSLIQESTSKQQKIVHGREVVSKMLQTTKEILDDAIAADRQISQQKQLVQTLTTEVSSKIRIKKQLEGQISTIESSKDKKKVDNSAIIAQLEATISELEKTRARIFLEQQQLNIVQLLFKDDGIKTRIIEQYLPILNQYVNHYLSCLNFYAHFELDANFNETIKSRYRDDFSYASFSEGEKLRINLALLFTWREISRLKNKVHTNLLILDEVFDSSLDEVGAEDFLKVLRDFDNRTNIFVISHRSSFLFDKFRSVLEFEKVGNFSQIKRKPS